MALKSGECPETGRTCNMTECMRADACTLPEYLKRGPVCRNGLHHHCARKPHCRFGGCAADTICPISPGECKRGCTIRCAILEDVVPGTGTRAGRFDAAIQHVTQDRGGSYGHPADNFKRIAALQALVADCPIPEVRHALDMICVKLSRLATTPDHEDSALDIAGYARTICMVLDRLKPKG